MISLLLDSICSFMFYLRNVNSSCSCSFSFYIYWRSINISLACLFSWVLAYKSYVLWAKRLSNDLIFVLCYSSFTFLDDISFFKSFMLSLNYLFLLSPLISLLSNSDFILYSSFSLFVRFSIVNWFDIAYVSNSSIFYFCFSNSPIRVCLSLSSLSKFWCTNKI